MMKISRQKFDGHISATRCQKCGDRIVRFGQNCLSEFCNAMVVHGPLSLGGLRTSQERKAPSLSHEKSLQNRPRNATLNFGTLTIQKKNKHTSTLWGITSTQGSAAREFEKSAAIMEIEPMCLNNRCISPVRDDVLK